MSARRISARQDQVDTAISLLIEGSRRAAPDELPALVAVTCAAFDGTDAQIYLADLQQRTLVPLIRPDGGPLDHSPHALGIDSTVAGRAFQQGHVLTQAMKARDSDERARVWLPLLTGAERLGVLGVTLGPPADDGAEAESLDRYAAVVAGLVAHMTSYGDSIVRTRRTSVMTLAAEIQWSLLPPLTFDGPTVSVAGGLEPAYEVGGDSLDYAVETGVTRFAVLDGMGHGIVSAQLISLAIAAYRNARRARQSLTDTAAHIESSVAAVFHAESFATGVLCELDNSTGRLTWISAGHQEPLLFRAGRLVRPLTVDPLLPFGLNHELGHTTPATVGTEQLEPGDVVFLYTDGVTDARSPAGDFFGMDRLTDHVTRSAAAGLPAPETMRRLVHALLEHQSGDLADDATLLQVTWHGPPGRQGARG